MFIPYYDDIVVAVAGLLVVVFVINDSFAALSHKFVVGKFVHESFHHFIAIFVFVKPCDIGFLLCFY